MTNEGGSSCRTKDSTPFHPFCRCSGFRDWVHFMYSLASSFESLRAFLFTGHLLGVCRKGKSSSILASPMSRQGQGFSTGPILRSPMVISFLSLDLLLSPFPCWSLFSHVQASYQGDLYHVLKFGALSFQNGLDSRGVRGHVNELFAGCLRAHLVLNKLSRLVVDDSTTCSHTRDFDKAFCHRQRVVEDFVHVLHGVELDEGACAFARCACFWSLLLIWTMTQSTHSCARMGGAPFSKRASLD